MAANDDLVHILCKGGGQRFHRTICAYYDPDAQVCTLLRDEPLDAVFEKGPCQPLQRIVQPLVAKHLTRYGYQHVCQDFRASAAALAEGLTAQYIRKQRLHDGYTLRVLWTFIHGIVSRKILDYVQQEGLLPKLVCGECVYLSRRKPHVCERMTIISAKDSREIPNPCYHQKKTPGKRACKEGFKPYTFTSVEFVEDIGYPPDDTIQQRIVWEHWALLLRQRAEHATTAEESKIYNRQHSVFATVAHLRCQGLKWADAVARVADKCGVSTKTIVRDLEQIERFLYQQQQ